MADFDYSEVLRLSDQLSRAPALRQAKLLVLLDRTSRQIESRARAAAPVGATGNLRASIAVERTGLLSRTVVAGAYYGRFVEYGTARQAPQPFMFSAADGVEEAFYLSVEVIAGQALD